MDKVEEIQEQKQVDQIDTTNIFEEFLDDANLHEEIDAIQEKKQKDLYYYLSIAGSVFKWGFLISLFLLVILWGYIWVQENPEMKDQSFLDPICFVFTNGLPSQETYCSSITALIAEYKEKKEKIKDEQLQLIIPLIEQSYRVNSFDSSKEVIFLLDKSENRIKALDILNDFDDLKNAYDSIEKEKIQCKALLLTNESLSMKCSAFTAGYEKNIIGFDAWNTQKIRWTSISLANSFINYIEKKSDIFEVTNRQKLFSSERVFWSNTNFTHKTEFNLELKYYYE